MDRDELEKKRAELNIYIDNLNLSCEAVVKKAREFEELANRVYEIRDGAYWMKRTMRLEELLKEAAAFCPAGYKYEIEKEGF